MKNAFSIARRPITLPSRDSTRRDIDVNTTESKMATDIDPTASIWPTLETAHRPFGWTPVPEKENGAVETTPMIAKNHSVVKPYFARFDSKNTLLARTRKRKVPRQVVRVANALMTCTTMLHRLSPRGATKWIGSDLCQQFRGIRTYYDYFNGNNKQRKYPR